MHHFLNFNFFLLFWMVKETSSTTLQINIRKKGENSLALCKKGEVTLMYYFPWVISHHISPRLYNFDWFIHSSKCYIITATQNILCCQNKRHHMLHQFESNASNYYMILEAHIIISSLISSVWNMKSVLLSL